jgi:hypothetical protein
MDVVQSLYRHKQLERTVMKTITIRLTSQQQVNALHFALQMQRDMQDDIVLDDTVTSVGQVRDLAGKCDADIVQNLAARRKDTSEAIDRLMTTIELQNQLQRAIDAQHD